MVDAGTAQFKLFADRIEQVGQQQRVGRPATAASCARFIFDEETSCIARVICRVFLTDLMRRRMSRRLAMLNN